MLEEALKSSSRPPAETATAMLHFVQSELPSGGSSAESRFFRLYGLLCERIFGPLGDEKEGYCHIEGGWLSQRQPWNRSIPGSSNGKKGLQRGSSSSMDIDPVVMLLAPATPKAGDNQTNRGLPPATLVEAISKETENNPSLGFTLPLKSLPKPLQDAWMALLDHRKPSQNSLFRDHANTSPKPLPEHCTSNDVRLLCELLSKHPGEQKELVAFRQNQGTRAREGPQSIAGAPLQLSPQAFGNNRRESFGSPSSLASPTKTDNTATTPHVVLSMLEYYLFLFLRFPLQPPIKSTATMTSPRGVNRYGGSQLSKSRLSHYGEKVYLLLVEKYLRYFLPYEPQGDRQMDFTSRNRNSELYVRTLIALWLDSNVQLAATAPLLHRLQKRRAAVGQDKVLVYNMNDSYDLVQCTTKKYSRPSNVVVTGIQKLIKRILLDPHLTERVQRSLSHNHWCLNATQTSLQLPFYNFVRSSFRFLSLHEDRVTFQSVLSTWLMYLEPWNVVQASKREYSPRKAKELLVGTSGSSPSRTDRPLQIILPRSSDKSRYTNDWEPYVCANLHIYVIPLAIFLRRSRELDFGTSGFKASIDIVKRVFRVFNPNVVAVLDQQLTGESPLAHLVKRHVENLEPYGPPSGVLSLKSLQDDMMALIEEIQTQHMKKIKNRDWVTRLEARIDGLFGGAVVSGEEKAVQGMSERAKVIVGWPMEKEIGLLSPVASVTLSSGTNLTSSANVACQLVTKSGTLTGQGRQKLLNGQFVVEPDQLRYRGDMMRARPKTTELSFMVELLNFISDFINEKLQLDENSLIRVNLRRLGLADIRVLVIVLFVVIVRGLRA